MKEQSAVDFLHSKILFNIGLDDNDIFKLRELVKIAKKLEDKQHGKTWDAALDAGQNRAWNVMRAYEDFDDWYQETFVNRGSDNKDVEKEMFELEQQLDIPSHMRWHNRELPQQEISDEEIEKGAWEYVYKHKINGHTIVHWNNAIKWYREQLKCKGSDKKD